MRMYSFILFLCIIFGLNAYAEQHFTGDITYVQVREDGKVAVKILPNGGTNEVYGAISDVDSDKMKAMYAMALTALTSGKQVEIWKGDDGLWFTIFLRKQ